mgnify:CR=1 FL=1
MKKALLFFIVLLSLVSCSRKTTSVEKEFTDSVRIERRDTLIQRQILTIADTVYLSDTVFITELTMVTVDSDGKVLRTDTEREKKIISNRNANYVNAKQEERQTSVTDKEETRKEKENKTVKEKPPILQRFKDSLFQLAAVLLMIIGAWYYFVYPKRSRSKNNP